MLLGRTARAEGARKCGLAMRGVDRAVALRRKGASFDAMAAIVVLNGWWKRWAARSKLSSFVFVVRDVTGAWNWLRSDSSGTGSRVSDNPCIFVRATSQSQLEDLYYPWMEFSD